MLTTLDRILDKVEQLMKDFRQLKEESNIVNTELERLKKENSALLGRNRVLEKENDNCREFARKQYTRQ